jgi:hypothetical protein
MRTRALLSTAVAAAAVLAAGCGGGAEGGGGSEFGAEVTAADIAHALKAQGLPIGKITVFNAATDPNKLLGRPGQYTSKVAFRDTRIKDELDPTDVSAGGGVEVSENAGDAKKRAEYVRGFTEGSGVFSEYSYVRGRVFLRVSHELTPRQAKEYESVLNRLAG